MPGRRALGVTAAVLPGALVHGAGHYVIGERDTAGQLLALEGVGLSMILGGGGVLFASGASRWVVGPAAAIAMMGFGVFGTSLLADVYGTAASDQGAARRPMLPKVETEFGYRRLEDVQFSHHDFLVEGMRLNQGSFGLGLLGFFSMGAGNARYRADVLYRFLDDSDVADSRYADRLELDLGFVRHTYPTERFAMTSGEASVLARYDLAHVGRSLRGSFAEFALGYARGAISYDIEGQHVPADSYDLLLGRFGFGVRLRGKSAPGSEALLYYDHRHDDFAAGLKVTGLGSGVAGHFGFQTKWYFNSSFGVLTDVNVGSAWFFGASLLLRQPELQRRVRSP
ncbi:MAG TPA: hypothetical protein VFQ35_18005 [Polyangiaceae bacterium]|nr:hypothetical protein [Polyangiaceae bacterium]